MFTEWTRDTLTGRQPADCVAEALLPSLDLYQDRLTDVAAVIGAIGTRLPQLGGEISPFQVLSKLSARLSSQAAVEAAVVQAALVLAKGRAYDVAAIKERGRILFRRPDTGLVYRVSLGVHLLLADAESGCVDSAFEADVHALLFDAASEAAAGSALVALAEAGAGIARGWNLWAREWLNLYFLLKGAEFVHVWILSRERSDEGHVQRALMWIDRQPLVVEAKNLLVQLLSVTNGRPDIIERALFWHEHNAGAPGAAHVLSSLALKSSGMEQATAYVFEWLSRCGTVPGAGQVISALLARKEVDIEKTVERMFEWLVCNPTVRNFGHLLRDAIERVYEREDALPLRSDFRERVTPLLRRYPEAPGLSSAYSSLLRRSPSMELVDAATAWLDAAHAGSADQELLAALVRVPQSGEMHVARAIAWLNINAGSMAGIELAASVLVADGLRGGSSKDVNEWIDIQQDQPELFRQSVAARARSLLDKERTSLDLGWQTFLGACAEHDPGRPRVVSAVQDYVLGDSHRSRKASVLGRWLKASGPRGAAIAFIADTKRSINTRRDEGSNLFQTIAETCAANASIVIAAAKSDLAESKNLLYLIASGTQYSKISAEEIYRLKREWPVDHMGFFWRAILSSRTLPPKVYLKDLVTWIGHRRRQIDEVLRSLAARDDIEQEFKGKFPPWAWKELETKRRERAAAPSVR